MDICDIKKQILRVSLEDYLNIIKLAKRVKKQESYTIENQIKIAVIGTCSLQYFVMVLRLFLIKYDILAEIYEGEYDGINTSVFDEQSDLYKFHPSIVIILSNYRDIRDIPDIFSDMNEIDDYIEEQGRYYSTLWEKISRVQGCYIFQSNIIAPMEREIGNLEANLYSSKKNIYQLINIELIRNKLNNVTIIDMDYIAAKVGKENWFDNTLYFTSKIEYSLKYIGIVCDIYAQQIASLQGKIKKCLVLDLDNTLWGGVVADEGAEGIKIDPNDAVGEAYRFFQQYVLKLKKRGVILAVISKNDYQIAKEPFEINENMILKYDDFSSFIANWENKAVNIEIVAKELNIGTDSLVFFDDNPAERELVKMYHPEVMVIDVPENVANYVSSLEYAHPFDWINLTEEDLRRTESYRSNIERRKLNNQYENYKEYLIALKMKGKVESVKKNNIGRFTQLINKSNQFNLRTQRYSEADINQMLVTDKYKLLSMTLEDRFSKFGIISCVILKKNRRNCFIDTWVMSCRVLKRDVEKLMFRKIAELAKEWDCEKIIGEYIPTKKNALVRDLYPRLGFQQFGEGEKNYVYNLEKIFADDVLIEEIV